MAESKNISLSPCAKDLTGKRFGSLVVVQFSRRVYVDTQKRKKGTRLYWKCLCDCGGETEVLTCHLTRGKITSCGCQQGLTIHGMADTPEYRVWMAMRSRCENPKTKQFDDYGGRGITVCERWLRFENFISDMGRRPSPKHTIERKENSGPYSPENCAWETRRAQSRNSRRNVIVEHEGKTQCLMDWSIETKISFATLRKRLRKGLKPATGLFDPVNMAYSRRRP